QGAFLSTSGTTHRTGLCIPRSPHPSQSRSTRKWDRPTPSCCCILRRNSLALALLRPYRLLLSVGGLNCSAADLTKDDGSTFKDAREESGFESRFKRSLAETILANAHR